jgi:hypothetical protein
MLSADRLDNGSLGAHSNFPIALARLNKRNNRILRAFESGAIGEPINDEGAIWERAYKSIVRRPRILSAPVRKHQP